MESLKVSHQKNQSTFPWERNRKQILINLGVGGTSMPLPLPLDDPLELQSRMLGTGPKKWKIPNGGWEGSQELVLMISPGSKQHPEQTGRHHEQETMGRDHNRSVYMDGIKTTDLKILSKPFNSILGPSPRHFGLAIQILMLGNRRTRT